MHADVGRRWYGWSAQERLHWVMPIIGGGIFVRRLPTVCRTQTDNDVDVWHDVDLHSNPVVPCRRVPVCRLCSCCRCRSSQPNNAMTSIFTDFLRRCSGVSLGLRFHYSASSSLRRSARVGRIRSWQDSPSSSVCPSRYGYTTRARPCGRGANSRGNAWRAAIHALGSGLLDSGL